MIPGNIFQSNSVGMTSISIHVLDLIVFRIPFNFALPGRNKISSYFYHTEHRVGEDVWLWRW